MRRIFTFWLVLTTLCCYGSNPQVDSLKVVVQGLSEPEDQIDVYRKIGRAYYNTQKQFDSAFYFAKIAYETARQEGLIRQQAQALFDHAAIYRAVGDLDKALETYQETLLLAGGVREGDPLAERLIAATLNNMGDIYLGLEEWDKAEEYFDRVHLLAIKHEYKDIEAIVYLNLGDIYFQRGSYMDSKKIIEKSVITYEPFRYGLPAYYRLLARTCYAMEEMENAEKFGKAGLKLAQKQSDLKESLDIALLLSDIYEKQREFEIATTYSDLAFVYNDSIRESQNRDELEKVLLTYQLQQQESELERLAQKNQYLTTIYVLIGIGVLLLVIVVLRQLKIARMTRSIHNIQNELIKTELEQRARKPATSFDAAKQYEQAE